MRQPSQPNGLSVRRLKSRLDHLFGELNTLLLAMVIGLAVLDFTCFVALKISAEFARAQSAVRTTSDGLLVPGGAVQPGIKIGSVGAAFHRVQPL